jgi:nucleoside-diphosphate-sugar epimerase
VFFTPGNSVICDPEPGAVARAVADLIAEDRPREMVRESVLPIVAVHGRCRIHLHGCGRAAIMRNNAAINGTVLDACVHRPPGRLFFSSSACVYGNLSCEEASAYPASPDSDYGFEKLFAERLYAAYARNCGLVGRFHGSNHMPTKIGSLRCSCGMPG